MTILPGLVVAIALLLVVLAIARRYLASVGIPTGWVSVPRILRTGGRLLGMGAASTWRVGKGTVHLFQRRRRIRRRPGRVSIGSIR